MNIELGTPAALAESWLVEAYELLELGWCRGAPARDVEGEPVEPESDRAASWSPSGALERAWRLSECDLELGLFAFQRANLALVAATGEPPAIWNERLHSKRHVLETVVVAISLVRSVRWAPGDAA